MSCGNALMVYEIAFKQQKNRQIVKTAIRLFLYGENEECIFSRFYCRTPISL